MSKTDDLVQEIADLKDEKNKRYVIAAVYTKDNQSSINVVLQMGIFHARNIAEAKGLALDEFHERLPKHILFVEMAHIKIAEEAK